MYTITTVCIGNKYTPILPYWLKQIGSKCPNSEIEIFNKIPENIKPDKYAWWDILRLTNNLNILLRTQKPVVHIDIDIIVRKDILPIVSMDHDIIISQEIGGDGAFPKECSQKLGFGICSGLYVLKPTAISFMLNILSHMKKQTFGTYSDQVSMMNYIVNNPHSVTKENYEVGGTIYENRIIHIDGIQICVLDFGLIIRDPIVTRGQFADHINIDNVGGVSNFLNYFNEPLENLPLTCRCGKRHLGDNSVCPHIGMR